MNQQFIQSQLREMYYVRKDNTQSSYLSKSELKILPKTLTIVKGNIFRCAKKGRNNQIVSAQVKGRFTKNEDSFLKRNSPYRVSTQIWKIENGEQFIGYGSIGISDKYGRITKDSDTNDLLILYGCDEAWNEIRIFYFSNMLLYLDDVVKYLQTVIV